MRANRASLGCTALLLAALILLPSAPATAGPATVDPGSLPAVGKVDKRFQSYNVEMVEVIGGRFWAPYPKPGQTAVKTDGKKSGGVDLAAGMFRKREPLDLKHEHRLRVLAKALGPAYVRVGGAWANSVYFQDDDAPAVATPPKGYTGVLTRAQWAGVVDFAKATDSRIVTSFGVSEGARDAQGVWNPDQARRLLAYTRSLGGDVYAAELINEPNVGTKVGLPKTYDAATFAKDQAVFRALVKSDAPTLKTVGPASTGEAGFMLFPGMDPGLTTKALMSAEPRAPFDLFAYHFYGTVSKRCSMMSPTAGISPDNALSETWLARADVTFDYYKALRDRFSPGAPIWVTEMAQAACGGDAWATTFLDTFRYVDQMGRLAKRGAAAIFHNTLSASDYALIDDVTLEPRPNYWAAVLWRDLMGETVLDTGPNTSDVHVYAHCLRDRPGGVGLVAINLSRTGSAALRVPKGAQRYTLTADDVQSGVVKLNGQALAMRSGDRLPLLKPAKAAGVLSLAPASITFLAIPKAANPACRTGARS